MLPDSAVEHISNEEIETLAETLLAEFREQSTRDDYPVPIEAIAEHHLGYELDITDQGLFVDPEFLGGISFEHNTIYVNASVENHEGRYSFTIAHEIGHHILHKSLYEQLVEDHSKILCRDKQKPLIERQADRFAAALLMPRSLFLSFKPSRPVRHFKSAIGLAARIKRDAHLDNVSLSAIFNRLKELGFIAENMPFQTGVQWRTPRQLPVIYRFFGPLYRLLKKIVN